MKIIQIVGFKGSGKTTLAKILIKTLANKGVKVAALTRNRARTS